MALQFFPCSELTIIVILEHRYVPIVGIFLRTKMTWSLTSIALSLRTPDLSLSHTYALPASAHASSSACRAIIIAHLSAFPSRMQVPCGETLWFGYGNGKESNICWINEWVSHRSLLSQIIYETLGRTGGNEVLETNESTWRADRETFLHIWKTFPAQDFPWLSLVIFKDREEMSTWIELSVRCVASTTCLQVLAQCAPHKDAHFKGNWRK